MYMLQILVLSFLCLLGSGVTAEKEASDGFRTPDFCKGIKCPRYRVVNKYNGFELRAYEPTNWVTTNLDWSRNDHDIESGFFRLYQYISGDRRTYDAVCSNKER
ncbi:Hypothetical predicted protein [Pelobates cultripes]|uniref:MHC class II antigen beta chain n=1 Tax=Pelobates cultripes TaxID=61616 RepID=A0AAD1RG66_PELCU|nr:Hypothetical predicted protein [Pelobates cultripes]